MNKPSEYLGYRGAPGDRTPLYDESEVSGKIDIEEVLRAEAIILDGMVPIYRIEDDHAQAD